MKFLKTVKLSVIFLCITTLSCDASLVQFPEKCSSVVESSFRGTTHQQEYAGTCQFCLAMGMYDSAFSTNELGLWPEKQQKVWEDFEKVEKSMIEKSMKLENHCGDAEGSAVDARDPSQVLEFKTTLETIIGFFGPEVHRYSPQARKAIVPTIKKKLLEDKTYLNAKGTEFTNRNAKTIVSELIQLLLDQYSTYILQMEMLKGITRNPKTVPPVIPLPLFGVSGDGSSQDTYGRAYMGYMKFSKRLNSILVAGLGDRETIQKLGPAKDGKTQVKINNRIIIQAHNHRSIHLLLRNSYTDVSSMKRPQNINNFSKPIPQYKALLLAELAANDFLHSQEMRHAHQEMCHILQGGKENARIFLAPNRSKFLKHGLLSLSQIHESYLQDGSNFDQERKLIQYAFSMIDRDSEMGKILAEMLGDLCKTFSQANEGIDSYELKARVRNLVMTFFLFREMGSILNKVTLKAKEKGLGDIVLSVEQCMRYYWAFLRLKKVGLRHIVAQPSTPHVANRLDFKIGVAYSNYLRDSQKLYQLKRRARSSSPDSLIEILTHKPEEFPSFEQLYTNKADHYQLPEVLSTSQVSAKNPRSSELDKKLLGTAPPSPVPVNAYSHIPQPPTFPTWSVDRVTLRAGKEINMPSSTSSENQSGLVHHFRKVCLPYFQNIGNVPTISKNYQMNTKEKLNVPQTRYPHQIMVPVPKPIQEPISQSLHTDARPVYIQDLLSNSYGPQSSSSPFVNKGRDESSTIPTWAFPSQMDFMTIPEHVTLKRKRFSRGKNLEHTQVEQDFNMHGSLMIHDNHSSFQHPSLTQIEDQVKKRKLVGFTEFSPSAETSVASQFREAFNFDLLSQHIIHTKFQDMNQLNL
ncbi:hypothetical protein CROQUDRAFT_131392 [Cronartium quercuum f. sp. fusiforme G11]|uniref:Uncharacterized protein n=1 Tax=Cronartium quercuum f. sp. fusiforme G11 TaxID=708437 RepID=A0A9P6NTI8_9BASI|nr:hypothetical protein CROQUDRAFT_131392 [Cronartium quercuum f. sp. fusiforme G11]